MYAQCLKLGVRLATFNVVLLIKYSIYTKLIVYFVVFFFRIFIRASSYFKFHKLDQLIIC